MASVFDERAKQENQGFVALLVFFPCHFGLTRPVWRLQKICVSDFSDTHPHDHPSGKTTFVGASAIGCCMP
jgi:hypothetical protein